MEMSELQSYYDSEIHTDDSDDSEEDPSFDVLEETRLKFSNISIERKKKPRVKAEMSEKTGLIDMVFPEQDQKDYETIQSMIKGGKLEKLKVDQCKIYLRKHSLRLTGNKETLIQRIKEHTDIVNGGADMKFPASSFVLNCKGDACTGDVVMFEQNVYEEFSIASRCANGPPCGTRIVAGRIVRESYGAAKQQHTFTIEVLWSKGEKPLPPLHQLLIKGRNLYRLKTMRQRWEDEEERARILTEKHARGEVARTNREARIQLKEMRKMQQLNRKIRDVPPERKKNGEKGKSSDSVPGGTETMINQSQNQQQKSFDSLEEGDSEQNISSYTRICGLNTPNKIENVHGKPNSILNAHMPAEWPQHRQHLVNLNCNVAGRRTNSLAEKNLTRGRVHDKQHMKYSTATNHVMKENQRCDFPLRQLQGFGQNHLPECTNTTVNSLRYSQKHSTYHMTEKFNAAMNPQDQGQRCGQKQTCRYYAQGRCYFGDRCKYWH